MPFDLTDVTQARIYLHEVTGLLWQYERTCGIMSPYMVFQGRPMSLGTLQTASDALTLTAGIPPSVEVHGEPGVNSFETWSWKLPTDGYVVMIYPNQSEEDVEVYEPSLFLYL